MICDCGLITKKRTFLDGIKSITGLLIVFRIQLNETTTGLYIKRCCFMSLVPSLYTFVDKSWLMYSNILIFDPKSLQIQSPDQKKVLGSEMAIQNVFNIKKATLDRLEAFGDEEFAITYIDSANLIVPEYTKATSNLNMAYQKLIKLDQYANNLKYKYSSVVHDNDLLRSPESKTEEPTVTTASGCEKCKSIAQLKVNLKEVKRTTHEKINKLQYELDILRKRSIDLKSENDKLKDENEKLTDINQSYFMNR